MRKNIKWSEILTSQKCIKQDLKKDIEYLGSDKKVASEKRRELKRKSEEREALHADLVGDTFINKLSHEI